MKKPFSSSVASASLGGILLNLLVLIGLYFLFYLVAFDRQQPTFDLRTGQLEYRSSPRWAQPARLPYPISLYGIPSSLWNKLFAPAEQLWFSMAE